MHRSLVLIYFTASDIVAMHRSLVLIYFMARDIVAMHRSLVLIYFIVRDIVKGIKNGCPFIVEIRGTQGCALVGDPARAVGECRDVAKAQP